MQSSVFNRLVTFLVWLLAAGSVVFWALKWSRGPSLPLAAAQAVTNVAQAPDTTALAKALGGGQVAINSIAKSADNTAANGQNSSLLASRFVLSGVVTGKPGVAVIAVDGKPARAYRVGSPLASDAVLHSIAPGKAMLASSNAGPAVLTLELPTQTQALISSAQPARAAAAPTIAPAPPLTAPMGSTGSNQAVGQPTDAAAQGATAPPKAARALANRVREEGAAASNESQAPNTNSQ